jgi:ribosomal protein S18 acetylase RimI-like enzyme
MEIRALDVSHRSGAVALWERTDLVRPWNPPDGDFDRAVTGESSVVLGGFVGDDLCATAMVGHDGHRGWVYYLAVEPALQSSGVGRRMMAAAESWVAAAGIPKIQLMVRATNATTTGFYESIGYRAEDTVVLSRRLDGPHST